MYQFKMKNLACHSGLEPSKFFYATSKIMFLKNRIQFQKKNKKINMLITQKSYSETNEDIVPELTPMAKKGILDIKASLDANNTWGKFIFCTIFGETCIQGFLTIWSFFNKTTKNQNRARI